MTPGGLLAKILARGVHVWAEDIELCLRAPKGALSSELRDALKANKSEVIALLGQRRKHAPASYAQRRLWFFDQLEPNRSTYNMHLTYRLTGALDVVALEQSLSAIVRRHETLRTSFTSFEDQPVQVIAEDVPFQVSHCELENGESDEDARLRRQVDSYTRTPFTLSNAPLMRAYLIRLRPDMHVLTIVLHHIIADGWSMRVVLRELAAHYAAFARGGQPAIDPLPLQYADYARTQRNWLENDLDKRLAYWREQLAGPPPPLMLPTDRSRPAFQTFHGGRELLELDPELVASLRKLSTDEGATLFMTLLAAFEVLLYRYSGQEDFVVGSPVAGRSHPGTENMIGFFVNTVGLRANFDGNPEFREYLRRTRETVLHAFEHEDLPFEKLVEELHPERDLSRTPLFQVLFNMINMGGDSLEMGDVTVDRLYRREPESKFDLTMYVRPKAGKIRLMLVYNRDLFDKETIVGMLRDLRSLLEAIAANADAPVASLPMAQREPDTTVALPESASVVDFDRPIHHVFEDRVSETPDNIAIATREHEWTYFDLNQRADTIAAGLMESTGAKNARIALVFNHGAPMIAAVLGALKAGKTYVPMDAGYPQARLRYMIDDAQVQAILTTSDLLESARELADGRCPVCSIDEFQPVERFASVDTDSETPAYILYTSGSTGNPKGVVQNHRNLQHFIDAYVQRLGLTPNDRLSLLSSFGFDAAVMDIFSALLTGASLVPINLKTETLPDAMEWMATRRVTVYHSTPTVFRAFISAVSSGENNNDIRTVVLGGEVVTRRDVTRFRKHFPSDCRLVNLYGSAEASFTCCHVVSDGGESVGAVVPIGHAVDRTEIRLLNAYGGEEPVFGEIVVCSRHTALGYWTRDAETAAVFGTDPEREEIRIYRTGDLGRRRADGVIEYLGRRDFQIKVRGYRVEPGEIETLLNRYPGVTESVVVAKEADGGDTKLVGYVVIGAGQSLDSPALRAHLSGRLPDYMIPTTLVTLDALPRTTSRKNRSPRLADARVFWRIRRRICRATDPHGRTCCGHLGTGADAGSHRHAGSVFRHRRSFAARHAGRIAHSGYLRCEPAPARTLRASDRSGTCRPNRRPSPRGNRLPYTAHHADFSGQAAAALVFQQRLWVLDQLGARDGAYTMSTAMRLAGELNVDALEKAFSRLIERHESLRTVFVVDRDEPHQKILPARPFPSLPSQSTIVHPMSAKPMLCVVRRKRRPNPST